jgi:hypothetical protein
MRRQADLQEDDSRFSFGDFVPNTDVGHIKGCMVKPILDANGQQVTGICRCVRDCPRLKAVIRRGRQLAKEHGW